MLCTVPHVSPCCRRASPWRARATREPRGEQILRSRSPRQEGIVHANQVQGVLAARGFGDADVPRSRSCLHQRASQLDPSPVPVFRFQTSCHLGPPRSHSWLGTPGRRSLAPDGERLRRHTRACDPSPAARGLVCLACLSVRRTMESGGIIAFPGSRRSPSFSSGNDSTPCPFPSRCGLERRCVCRLPMSFPFG